MCVFHAEDMAEDALAEMVADEMSGLENAHLAFRGNSIATKAMEAYVKMVGEKYLRSTLQNVVNEIILSDVDLEVDPTKINDDDEELTRRRSNLKTVVKTVWGRISKSQGQFPPQLQRCFHKIRNYLEAVGLGAEVADNLVSSCLFLRYLCPAVLSPSLFGLTDEYPGERANRNLTLVAKVLQTLANFTRYEGKENSMEFLNEFLEVEATPMRAFLRRISAALPDDWIPNLLSAPAPLERRADLGRHLSCLHTVLSENISKINENVPVASRLRRILDELNALLHRPSIPELEQISQPIMTTLRQIQDSNPAQAASKASSFPWSWTLPKKSKNANFSHPAPHHEVKKSVGAIIARPEPVVLSLSSEDNTSSSAASLSPSPGQQPRLAPQPPAPTPALACGVWPPRSSSASSSAISSSQPTPTSAPPPMSKTESEVAEKQRLRQQHRVYDSCSAVSLLLSEEEEASSDDSTYSSQCQSDATSTPRTGFFTNSSSTLPRRPLTGAGGGYATHGRHRAVKRENNSGAGANKTLSDYEQEILELRAAMETLQIKLGEAERKLQQKSTGASSEAPVLDPVQRQEENEEAVKVITKRLHSEEDQLRRREDQSKDNLEDKEKMILMQQKKIACLDEANGRLMEQLTILGCKLRSEDLASSSSSGAAETSNMTILERQHQNLVSLEQQETPRTVDELIDSLHSTPI